MYVHIYAFSRGAPLRAVAAAAAAAAATATAAAAPSAPAAAPAASAPSLLALPALIPPPLLAVRLVGSLAGDQALPELRPVPCDGSPFWSFSPGIRSSGPGVQGRVFLISRRVLPRPPLRGPGPPPVENKNIFLNPPLGR